jgi:hypothetical protein
MWWNALEVCGSSLALVHLAAAAAIRADDPPPSKADLAVAVAKLKALGIACNEFHDARGGIPDNVVAKDGTPLLSWRVAILPYINEESLYTRFKLDEPWDSAHNKKLIDKMPDLYRPVRGRAKAGFTFYQVFEGEDTLFIPKKPRFTWTTVSMLNGTSNTGLIYEAGEPVIWSRPVDMHLDPKKPLPRLGGLFDGDFHVVMCDGHVCFLKKDPDPELLKCLINPANAKVFDGRKLMKPPPGKS